MLEEVFNPQFFAPCLGLLCFVLGWYSTRQWWHNFELVQTLREEQNQGKSSVWANKLNQARNWRELWAVLAVFFWLVVVFVVASYTL